MAGAEHGELSGGVGHVGRQDAGLVEIAYIVKWHCRCACLSRLIKLVFGLIYKYYILGVTRGVR